LMEAVDAGLKSQLEILKSLLDASWRCTITGRGTVATGRIETGIANTGDAVEIIGMGAEKLTLLLQELRCSVKSLIEVKLEIT
jgi:elongation factor Tu